MNRGAHNAPHHPARGEHHGKAVLREFQVRRLKELYFLEDWSVYGLARLFLIGQTTARNIVKRKTWRHVQ